jgi:hypothetical protein
MKRAMLTDSQIALARSLWNAGKTRDEIAFAIGVSVDVFRARCHDQLRDLPPRNRRANSGRRSVDPTPEEIIATTAEIRAGWPDERFLPEPVNDLKTTAF